MRTETLTLVEYEEVPVANGIVELVPATFWTELGVKVTRAPGESGWRVKADALAGIARTVGPELDLTVVIEPKLRGADVVFLAEWAFGERIDAFRRPQADLVGVDATYTDPVAAMLIWYVDSVAEFATRWLRRSYRTERVVLEGQVRGRMLVQTYVSQYRSTARDASVPCVLTVRTIDTPNNRLLKAGLRRVAKLGRSLPSSPARMAVKAAVNATLPRFAEVADIEMGPRDLRATNWRGPERHYKAILETTMSLLSGHYLSPSPGSSLVDSFLWSMPTLFQEALRALIRNSVDLALDSSHRPSARIHDGTGAKLASSRIDPDYVVSKQGRVALLDAKYKAALTGTAAEGVLAIAQGSRSIRVARSDIYQMAAYRQHSRWSNAPVGLVYPVVLEQGEPLPDPYEVREIGEPIRLYFLDIGPFARSNLAAFFASLEGVLVANDMRLAARTGPPDLGIG